MQKKSKNMIDYFIPIGIIFVFLGIIIIFAGSILSQGTESKDTGTKQSDTKVHVGFGGFIGPIPFGFANSRTALYMTLGATAFFMIVWLVLRYRIV